VITASSALDKEGPQMGSDSERESLGDLLRELASSTTALVRDEILLARQELREKLEAVRRGLLLLAIAAAAGLAAFLLLCAAAVVGVAHFAGWLLAALIIAIGLALIAALVGLAGLRRLKGATLKPEKTIQTLKEDKEWLTGRT
jgi:uncharacterized membrane protein YqjE